MAKSYAISQSQLVEIETARKKNRNKNVERRLYVLVMRAEGKSLEEISKKTGYHKVDAQLVSDIAKWCLETGYHA